MRRTLHLHFAKFDISTDRLELDGLLERLYADNDLTGDALTADAAFTPVAGRLHLDVVDEDALGAEMPARAVFAETNLCAGRCYYLDGTFTAIVRGDYPLRVDYDIESATLRARLSPRFLDDPQLVIGRVLRPFLQSFLLPFFRLKSVHAAAVARDGRGTLLVGPGGSGKTTTAIELAHHGFTLLSDDGPLLTKTSAGAVVLSSLDYVHATDGTLALFPNLRGHVVGVKDHREKYAIARRAFGDDDRWREPVAVDTYVELRRSRISRPAITPMPRREVLADLVRDSMIVFRHPALRQPRFTRHAAWTLDCLGALVAGLRAFRVEFADEHLHELPALVASL